jgi:cobyric acid synthase
MPNINNFDNLDILSLCGGKVNQHTPDKTILDALDMEIIPYTETTFNEEKSQINSTKVSAASISNYRENFQETLKVPANQDPKMKLSENPETQHIQTLDIQIINEFQRKIKDIKIIEEIQKNYTWVEKYLSDLYNSSKITLQTLNNSLQICKAAELERTNYIQSRQRNSKLTEQAIEDAFKTFEDIDPELARFNKKNLN